MSTPFEASMNEDPLCPQNIAPFRAGGSLQGSIEQVYSINA